MSKVKALKSQIFMVGTKFVVSSIIKGGSFLPGTTGFISLVKGRDQDYTNVVHLKCIITKRGKAGKERLSPIDFSTQIFDFKDDELFKTFSNNKRRYYANIVPVLPTPRVIQDMPDIDFLAWAMAYAGYLHKLSGKVKYIRAWPKNNDDLLNRYLHVNSYFNDDIEFTKNEYSNNDVREEFITRIRIMESSLANCVLTYKTKIAMIEEAAIRNIAKQGVIGKKSVIKMTSNYFSKKKDLLKILRQRPRNDTKNVEKDTLVQQIADGMSWL